MIQTEPITCAKQVHVTAAGERKEWRLLSTLQFIAGVFLT
jgi:hypothetical protein